MGQLARPVVHHVAAVGPDALNLSDGEQRLLGGMAKNREDGHAGPEVDRIVAPFSRGHAHAVEVQEPGEFPTIERNDTATRPLIGEAVKIVHAVSERAMLLTELLQKVSRG